MLLKGHALKFVIFIQQKLSIPISFEAHSYWRDLVDFIVLKAI